ncbi:competence protein ComJ [Haloferula sp. BvORR071]|uniref:competence protein ComJ n=1 Tax=Haloferula sp. BvORR071 TaxID=1396141 RepID=UPI00054FD222|nr:competence protein ComJ [Haloferula sp. BvORR071]
MNYNSSEPLFHDLYFSYSMFAIFDNAVGLPRVNFTKIHIAQGFGRNESGAWFHTPEEYGMAYLRVAVGPFEPTGEYDRAVSVPFRCVSGQVTLAGPDEGEGDDWTIELAPGDYLLTVAQRITQPEDEDHEAEEEIDLFFEPLAQPASRSEILIADEKMEPPAVLQEDGGIAGK